MNHELIKRFSKAATQTFKSWDYHNGNTVEQRLDHAKFAELIIEECISELEDVGTGDHCTDDWDRGYDAGLAQAIETIKAHFGVE